MPKRSKNSPHAKEDCPIEFCWGTFCRLSLQEPGSQEFSLISVLPTLKAILQFKPGASKNLIVSLGPLCAYSVFRRKAGFEGELQVSLDVDIDFPEQKSLSKALLLFAREHQSCQAIMKFMNPTINTNSTLGTKEFSCQVTFRYGNNVLSTVKLPVAIEVIKNHE